MSTSPLGDDLTGAHRLGRLLDGPTSLGAPAVPIQLLAKDLLLICTGVR